MNGLAAIIITVYVTIIVVTVIVAYLTKKGY